MSFLHTFASPIAFCIGLIYLTSACSNRLHPNQFQSYIYDEKNGLTVSDTFGNLKVTCVYFPNEYLAWYEANKTGDDYRKVLESMKGEQYLELRLSDSKGEKEFLRVDNDPIHYQERLNYLLQDFSHDISMVEGMDTLPVKSFHLERTFNLLPYNKVLLTFSRREASSIVDKKLVIRDPAADGRPMLLTIRENSIKDIPSPKNNKRKSHAISQKQASF